jgi:tol-pal system beta propeller repeat protein TolB
VARPITPLVPSETFDYHLLDMKRYLAVRRSVAILGAVALLSVGCAALAGRPSQVRIAFERSLEGHSAIYTIRPDGTDPVRVSQRTGWVGNPEFSPNRRRIVFEGAPLSIFVARSDGSDVRRLVRSGYEPKWSPNGDKLLFHVYRNDDDVAIFSINPDGTQRTELTNGWINSSSAWSPDGSRIVFVRDADLPQLWTMDADGSRKRRLTRAPGKEDFSPEFSPDGTRVLFTRSKSYGYRCLYSSDIFVTNADGSGGTTNLTKTCRQRETRPHWSPDGTTIVFTKPGANGWQIYVMNADGTGVRPLTDGPGRNHSPTWSPDGTEIAFISTRDGNAELYVMSSDGSNQTRLTRTSRGEESQPAW